jgi:hypothetical protein
LGLTKTDRKSSANQWIKNYPTDDYLKVLENFVKVERTIINNLIIAHGLEKELPSVTKRELKDALEIIALFR